MASLEKGCKLMRQKEQREATFHDCDGNRHAEPVYASDKEPNPNFDES
jgi:hypothetical protein